MPNKRASMLLVEEIGSKLLCDPAISIGKGERVVSGEDSTLYRESITKLQDELHEARRESLIYKQKVKLIVMLESAGNTRDSFVETTDVHSTSSPTCSAALFPMSSEMRSLRKQSEDRDVMIEDLRTDIDRISNESQDKLCSMKQSIQALSRERDELKRKAKDQKMSTKKLQEKIEKVMRINRKFKSDEKSMEIAMSEMRRDLVRISKENVDSMDKNRRLVIDCDRLRKQMKDFDVQRESLIKTQSESKVLQIEQNEELNALRQELKESKHREEQLAAKVDAMCKEQKHIMKENKGLSVERDTKHAECLKLRNSLDSISFLKKSENENLDRFADLQRQHREDMFCLKEQIKALLDRNEGAEQRKSEIIRLSQEEEQRVLTDYEQLKSSMLSVQSHSNQQIDENSKLKEQVEDIRKQWDSLCAAYANSETKLMEKEREVSILQNALESSEETNRLKEGEAAELERKVEEFEKLKRKLQGTIARNEDLERQCNQIDNDEDEVQLIKQSLAAWKVKYADLTVESNELRSRLKSAQKATERQDSDDNGMQTLISENVTLRKMVKRLSSQIKEREAITKKKMRIHREIINGAANRDAVEMKLQSRLSCLNAQIGKLRRDQKQMETQYGSLLQTNESLQQRNADLERSNASLRGSLQKLLVLQEGDANHRGSQLMTRSKGQSNQRTSVDQSISTATLKTDTLIGRLQLLLGWDEDDGDADPNDLIQECQRRLCNEQKVQTELYNQQKLVKFVLDILHQKELNVGAVSQILSKRVIHLSDSATDGKHDTLILDFPVSLVTHLTVQGTKSKNGMNSRRQLVSLHISYKMPCNQTLEWTNLGNNININAQNMAESIIRVRPFFAQQIHIEYTPVPGKSSPLQRKCKFVVKVYGKCCNDCF